MLKIGDIVRRTKDVESFERMMRSFHLRSSDTLPDTFKVLAIYKSKADNIEYVDLELNGKECEGWFADCFQLAENKKVTLGELV